MKKSLLLKREEDEDESIISFDSIATDIDNIIEFDNTFNSNYTNPLKIELKNDTGLDNFKNLSLKELSNIYLKIKNPKVREIFESTIKSSKRLENLGVLNKKGEFQAVEDYSNKIKHIKKRVEKLIQGLG